MAIARTSNIKLRKPPQGYIPWNTQADANNDYLDSIAALRNFAVTPHDFDASELPASLLFDVAGGDFITLAGVRTTIAARPGLAAAASATTYVWLATDGTIGTGPAYPTAVPYAPLARVVADATRITGITDDREPVTLVGGIPFGQLYLPPTYINYQAAPTYQMTASDVFVIVDATWATGGITVLTPPFSPRGNLLMVKRLDDTSNTVVVSSLAGGSYTLSHGDTLILYSPSEDGWDALLQTTDRGLSQKVTTASLTADDSLEYYRCDASAGPITITLPGIDVGISPGRVFTFKKVDASANAVTIQVDAAHNTDRIDGQTSVQLTSQFQVVRLLAAFEFHGGESSAGVRTWDII